nr:MAG TPA: hypothetical protein [Caudoviricetes sp.]
MQQTTREVCRISLERFAANHLRGCWRIFRKRWGTPYFLSFIPSCHIPNFGV